MRSASEGMRLEGEGEAPRPVRSGGGDSMHPATLQRHPSGAQPQDALAVQAQAHGLASMPSADEAALLHAQRQALLHLRQQAIAAAAQRQLMHAQAQLQQLPAAGPHPLQHLGSFGRLGSFGAIQSPTMPSPVQQQPGAQQSPQQAPQQAQQELLVGPVLEVDSDLLEKEGDRVVSALSGGRSERAWALNALCLLSYQQEIRLSDTPGLLSALLPVLQEGLAEAVGLSREARGSQPPVDVDEQRRQQGLPPLPGWQVRRADQHCRGLFASKERLEERLQQAAAAATVLRNVAEVQQNAALLLDPPVMRCWTWSLDASRELVQQQVGSAVAGREEGGSGGDGSADGGRDEAAGDCCGSLVVASGGTAEDICTSLLQMATALSGRMLLPAFFECGMLLLRSLLILLRPSWQFAAAAAGGASLPPPLLTLATKAVTAVATAYQPNTDILLSMTGSPGGGLPGATLMQVVADLLVCPFDVFRQHAERQVDEECPGWRMMLPTDRELLVEARRTRRSLGRPSGPEGLPEPPAQDRSTAELCTLDVMAVLSQLRYLAALLHLLWRLLSALGHSGGQARAAVGACPRLLGLLCEIAVHRWPQHPARWHAEGHLGRHPEAYPAYLHFLSHDMMPAMRERQELLQPLRADAAALLALLAADPQTRNNVAWCEGQLVTSVMLGVVSPTEPGILALLSRFATQGSMGMAGFASEPAPAAVPAPPASSQPAPGAAQPPASLPPGQAPAAAQ